MLPDKHMIAWMIERGVRQPVAEQLVDIRNHAAKAMRDGEDASSTAPGEHLLDVLAVLDVLCATEAESGECEEWPEIAFMMNCDRAAMEHHGFNPEYQHA